MSNKKEDTFYPLTYLQTKYDEMTSRLKEHQNAQQIIMIERAKIKKTMEFVRNAY